jgi:peptide/nickel transport system substrate-binding protein
MLWSNSFFLMNLSQKSSQKKIYAILAIVIVVVASIGGFYYYQLSQAPKAKSIAVYSYVSDFPDLDPSSAFEDEQVILANTYEDLVYFDPSNAQPLQPWLATSWNSSADGLTWTFHLRTGVTFHDGTPFNAEAVKFSLERTMNLGLGGAYIWDPVKTINVIDDSTVQLLLKYPAPVPQMASSQYAAWIISPKIPANASDWFNQGHDAGTGPYMIKSYQKGAQVTLEQYPSYWKGWTGPHFTDVVFRVDRDPSVRLQAVQSGDADMTLDIPVDLLSNIQGDTNVVAIDSKAYRNLVGMINTVKAPTDNVLVRQAISYAFPYKDVIDSVWRGHATQSTGPVPAGMLGHFDDLPQYSLDLNKAKDLLTQAGYPNGGFTITLTYTSGDEVEKAVAELYKAQLAKLNINLDIQEMTTRAKYSLARGDPTQAQNIILFYWWPTYITAYDFLFNLFHSEKKHIFNFSYYNNSQYDNLIDQASQLEGTDQAQAMQMYKQAQNMLIQDAASLFIFDQDTTIIYNSKIHNLSDNPAYIETIFFYNVWEEAIG